MDESDMQVQPKAPRKESWESWFVTSQGNPGAMRNETSVLLRPTQASYGQGI